MKTIAKIVLLLCAGLLGWLLLSPSPFKAVAWNPAPAPAATGVLAPNTELQKATLLAQGQIKGPEDIAVDAQGRVYSGLADGRIVRLDPDGSITTLANTGGRPLGVALDAAGNLIVCDSYKGLLELTPDHHLLTLATGAEGVPFGFTDDLDIAADGKIYFTDASSKYHQPDYLLDMMEGHPYGRLLVYDPATLTVKVLLRDLHFANGVALSQRQDAVFVAETYRYRIRKYWISGIKAGTNEIIADNLPGMPDNLDSDGQGTLWVALPTPRKAIADVSARHPWLRELLVKLPRVFWPKPDRYGLVVAMDEHGKILKSLHDPSGDHLRMITSVYPWQGHLYFGSLENDRIGRL